MCVVTVVLAQPTGWGLWQSWAVLAWFPSFVASPAPQQLWTGHRKCANLIGRQTLLHCTALHPRNKAQDQFERHRQFFIHVILERDLSHPLHRLSRPDRWKL